MSATSPGNGLSLPLLSQFSTALADNALFRGFHDSLYSLWENRDARLLPVLGTDLLLVLLVLLLFGTGQLIPAFGPLVTLGVLSLNVWRPGGKPS